MMAACAPLTLATMWQDGQPARVSVTLSVPFVCLYRTRVDMKAWEVHLGVVTGVILELFRKLSRHKGNDGGTEKEKM